MKVGNEIRLPAVWAPEVRGRCGRIKRLLRREGTVTISSIEVVNVSARRKGWRLQTHDDQAIVATSWKKCPPMDGVQAILLVEEGLPVRWLHHSLVDEHCEQWAEGASTALRDSIIETWRQQVHIGASSASAMQLRPPQRAALYAIGAHWTLNSGPATVVMPTGTGKTETMLSAWVSFVYGTILVAVPSIALREQTVRKCLSLGLLEDLGVVEAGCPLPIVGIVEKRPRSAEDVQFFAGCNAVIGTVSSLAPRTGRTLENAFAPICSYLVLDEAHHVAAKTWNLLRKSFAGKHVLQFTATPFRRDKEEVDGECIFNYPLVRAQQDGYFQPIKFVGVAPPPSAIDRHIATRAVVQLRLDLSAGLDHVLMARCSSIARATEVLGIYVGIAAEFSPQLIHSKLTQSELASALEALTRRRTRLIVCVDMLGEGFDLPQLKVAALHDAHKSLAVMLQFVGRFTRTLEGTVGQATVVANIDDPSTPEALERLYVEDADWNHLLADYSFEKVREHQRLLEFLRSSKRLDEYDPSAPIRFRSQIFRCLYSCEVYQASNFRPHQFGTAVSKSAEVRGVWLNEATNLLFYVTLSQPGVPWARRAGVRNVQWDLFVVYYNQEQGLLFVHSSEKGELHKELARAVGGSAAEAVSGERIFKSLGRINRLLFQNIGVKSRGRRKLRYSKYAGADVAEALTPTQTGGKTKSDVFATGYDGGAATNIGCSAKGRIWSRTSGPLPHFAEWCDHVGSKLTDPSISVDDIIANVMIPRTVESLPDRRPLFADWPTELIDKAENRVRIFSSQREATLTEWTLSLQSYDFSSNQVVLSVQHEDEESRYGLRVNDRGFQVVHLTGEQLRIAAGATPERAMEDFLSDYPPIIVFVDGSELDGCDLIEQPECWAPPPLPRELLTSIDWTGIDIAKESMWKDGQFRGSSVQAHMMRRYTDQHFDVVFDDDGKGEAADLVCIKDYDDWIEVHLVHCKYSGGARPGERVTDVQEVCAQALRSAKWSGRFVPLLAHIRSRSRLLGGGRDSRFRSGSLALLSLFKNSSKIKPVRFTVLMVQPGVQANNPTDEQLTVMSAAHGYLLETVGCGLRVICS